MDEIIKIRQFDFQKIQEKTKEIKDLATQALTGNDQQRINCLDHIIAWANEIVLYSKRGIIKWEQLGGVMKIDHSDMGGGENKMREIKFKFWHKELHKMSRVLGLGVVWEHLVDQWGVFNWEDVEKLQYTGLKDKNGKEIYEGDILRGGGKHYQVVFEIMNESPAFVLRPSMPFIINLKSYEVIGNIHENPELVGK